MSGSEHGSPATTVVFVVPSLTNSSAHWEPLFGALGRLGASVVAVGTGSAPPGISARMERLPGTLVTVRRRGTGHNLQFYLVSPALIGLLRKIRPDVIICMEYSIASMWAIVAGRWLGRRVYIFQEHAAAATLRPGFLKTAYRRLLVRLAQGVIANTPEARAEVLDVLKARPDTVVDLPLLVPRDPGRSCTPPEPSPSTTEGPEFLVVGRLVAPKNVEAVLDATAVLRAEGLRFGVTIAGDGPHAAALHDHAVRAGVEDAVTFVGAVPGNRIGHYYRRADAFVLPSLGDYRSVSVLEALQFGLPVVDSIFDGNAHTTVRHGHNGFVVDPRSVKELAGAMRTLIVDGGLRAAMAAQSARTLRHLTPESSASAVLERLR
ncbi:glycosyltransferase family 4 protein [Blastococcus tunisiensis]|uniref:Glycosyl transferase 4-like domain-containing protein n=1 Tax=Blastococcus tunisiensis TaxID=1798228 RepID=A0A1I2JE52_9ACTN|nr:glycosyltransferase family 4 protein [Blastococcus sp. DSM 46838]SFF51447.1 Glycosyl transferase 4-like domain-containing protein [Blastococcus sp. DSM 46838]